MMLMVCILCMNTFASAVTLRSDNGGDKGSVCINVADFAKGTVIAVCNVGTYEDGAYVLFDGFKDCGADLTDIKEASKSQAAAAALAERAVSADNGIMATVIEEDGKAYFSDLVAENSLYVFFQLDNGDVVRISPMLIVLPYYDDNYEPVTDVVIDAKYEDVRVKEKKGAVILNKVSPSGEPLEGAEFRFEESVGDDESEGTWNVISSSLTTDKNGQIVVIDLPFGTYRFVETKAPAGYVLSNEMIVVVIEKEGTVKLSGKYIPDDGEPYEVYFENSPEESSEPPSEPESSKPESSKPKPSEPPTHTGEDITKFIVIGCVVGGSLVVVIILVVITSKRKK